MIAQEVFCAGDAQELSDRLERWGEAAPKRLERRGRQKELERWCLNRFFRHRIRAGLIEYPVVVKEGENPDFEIREGPDQFGLEVVEACDPCEQRAWTEEARQNQGASTPVLREIDLLDPGRQNRFKELIFHAIEAKEKRCSDECAQLLIYPNTLANFMENLDWMMAALGDPPRIGDRFAKIWVLGTSGLLELRRGSILVA